MREKSKIILFDADIKRLDAIKAYISANLDNDLNAAVLAAKFDMSKSTLRRHFLTQNEKTVYNYILECRMEKAMELLQNHSIPISQIGMNVGYREASSFTHAFTKYYNHPPAHFLRPQQADLT